VFLRGIDLGYKGFILEIFYSYLFLVRALLLFAGSNPDYSRPQLILMGSGSLFKSE
jgi:uncharacterized protein (UPF0332 family)